MPEDSLKKEALAYAKAGFPIFPCIPLSKRPLTKHGFKDATSNIAMVERWWTLRPDANIAVATGGKWAVVDVDPRNGGSKPEWVPSTWTARTPSGGQHFWLAVDSPVRSRVLSEGVDLKAEGGYVLVPPSRTDKGEYEWYIELAPAHVTAEQLAEYGVKSPSDPLDGVASSAPPEIPEYVGAGARHDTLTKLARYYRGLYGWDYEELAEILMIHNENFDPPIEDLQEVGRIARWASRLRLED